MDEKPKDILDDVLLKVEEQLAQLVNSEGVKRESVEYLYKLVDIHKDIKNEEYWKMKEDKYNEIRRKL